MKEVKSVSKSQNIFDELINQANGQISEWKQKIDVINERLSNEIKPEFHEMQDFVIDRLTSHACAKHQGYVMQGFELDSEMASYLFLESSDDKFEFNELTKPDYVIIMNRLVDQFDVCLSALGKYSENVETSGVNDEMRIKLQKY